MKIKKSDNGNVREFEIKEFVEKLVAKEAIKNTDKIYYCENPQKLCEELNSNEKQFGIKYSCSEQELVLKDGNKNHKSRYWGTNRKKSQEISEKVG